MISLKDWLIVIPARLGSSRLEAKPLADLGGKPLVVRVYDRCAPLAQLGAKVLVATDHPAVIAALEGHGITGVLTASTHQSGTDRVAEVARQHPHPFVMNVQGDEPFIDALDLEQLARRASATPGFAIGTLLYRNQDHGDFLNPNIVKCVRASDGMALYFSRAGIPHHRDGDGMAKGFWHHLGIYAFTQESLRRFCSFPPSSLEQTEKLEQLRALENGMSILTVEARTKSIGIDTPEDLQVAREQLGK